MAQSLGELENKLQVFRKILVATDASVRAPRLVSLAAALAKALDAEEVIVATVSSVSTGVQGNDSDGLPANSQEREAADTLRRLIDEAFGDKSERVDVKVLHGDPADRIVEFSTYSGCDLIIIGSRGQGTIRRAVVGSVSSDVVARSGKPVLVVK